MRRARRFFGWTAALLLAAFVPMLWFDLGGGEITCPGETDSRRTAAVMRLAASGENFGPYCWLCIPALRTYGRAEVIATVEAAYADLAARDPETYFKYGEIGWPWGGRFPPHRTHRDGLSVDFMVPLVKGRVVLTHAFNRAGYDLEFDTDGRLIGDSAYTIAFYRIGAHLERLEAQARRRGGRIRRVFLAPDLQDNLFDLHPGLGERIEFNRAQSWVRHDDHYHVDFEFPCAD